MASLLTITNLTRSRISFDSSTSSLAGLETRTIEVTVEELEKLRSSLTSFSDSSLIRWEVTNDTSGNDRDAQFVTLADLQVGISTTTEVDLYVDAASGDDNNAGSSTQPLKTYAAAVAKIPSFVSHTFTIHLAPHPGDGYKVATIENKSVSAGATIHVTGDDHFNVLLPPTNALAGSSDVSVSAAALTVDAYLGKTIEVLTGAAAGDRRLVRNNTATSIVPVAKFTAPLAANDVYRIVEPSVVFSLSPFLFSAPGSPGDDLSPAVRNCPGVTDKIESTSIVGSYGPPSVTFSNLSLGSFPASPPSFFVFPFSVMNSSVAFYGISLFSSDPSSLVYLFVDIPGVLMAGVDHVATFPNSLFPFMSGLAPNDTSWTGWGVSLPSSGFFVPAIRRFVGYVCTETSLRVSSSLWRVLGGSINSDSLLPGQTASLLVTGHSRVLLGFSGSSPPVLIRSTQDAPDRGCLEAYVGSSVEILNTLLEKTNQGTGISSFGVSSGEGGQPGFIGVGSGVEIRGVTGSTPPDHAMLVYVGGVINTRSDVSLSGWTAGQELAVRTRFGGAGTTIETADLSSLSSNNASLPSIGTADGRYGWIRRM